MEKRFITPEEAINVLPKGKTIHTFFSNGVMLVGADWDREDVLKNIKELTDPEYEEFVGRVTETE